MTLVEQLSDLAIKIGTDIKALVTSVNGFKSDLSTTNGRIDDLEQLHQEGSNDNLTLTDISEELQNWGIYRNEYIGEGWYKDENGRVYCKGVPSGETHKFAGDDNTYVSLHDSDLDNNDSVSVYSRLLDYGNYVAATSNLTKLYYEEYGEIKALAKDTKSNDVSSWDVGHIENFDYAFYDTSRLKGLNNIEVSSMTSAESMLAGVYFDEEFDISNWDTSSLINAKNMFGVSNYGYGVDLKNVLNIERMNVGKVQDMSNMFKNADFGHDNTISFGDFDVRNVDNFEDMFAGGYEGRGTIIGLDTWRIKDGATLDGMLSGQSYDFSGNDLSKWCVSHLSSEPANFANSTLPADKKPVWGTCPYQGYGWYKDENGVVYCNEVPFGETHQFDGDPTVYFCASSKRDAERNPETAATSRLTSLNSLFYYDTGIADLDLSHWDVSNVKDFSHAFQRSDFNNDSIVNWNTKSAEEMYGFAEYSSLNQDLSGWCVPKVTEKPYRFAYYAPMENDTAKHPVWGTCPRGEDQSEF